MFNQSQMACGGWVGGTGEATSKMTAVIHQQRWSGGGRLRSKGSLSGELVTHNAGGREVAPTVDLALV